MNEYDNTMNKLANVHNRFQGDYKRALFLCSAGLLRSATAQAVFSAEPYNWNTRNAGVTAEYALIDVSLPLLVWAQEVYVMEARQVKTLEAFMEEVGCSVNLREEVLRKTFILNIPDEHAYRSPALIALLKTAMENPVPATPLAQQPKPATEQQVLDGAEKAVTKKRAPKKKSF